MGMSSSKSANAYLVYNVTRSVVACGLTLAAFIVLMVGLSMNVNLARFGGPVAEILIFFAFSFLLFINEGYQVALLGVRNMSEQDLEKFPHAKRIRKVMFEEGEDKLPRLFLGQSFLVVLSTFLISQLTTFPYYPTVTNVSDGLVSFFVRSGFSGVIFTVNISQLLPSLIAQKYPAEFLNVMPLVLPVIRIALFIETIGIVQATYVVVHSLEGCFRKQAPTSSESKNSCKRHIPGCCLANGCCCSWSWESLYTIAGIKTVFSVSITLASAGFMLYSIVMGYSALQVSPDLIVYILPLAYLIIFYCEGLKIAIVGSGHLTRKELEDQGYSTVIHDILAKQDDGIARFLLGRQLICVPIGFLIATITNFNSGYENLSPALHFLLVGLGLPGMLVTMQLAQLAPQVIASRHTKQFLEIFGGSVLVLLALFIELFGITQCAYVIRGVVERICPCNESSLLTSTFSRMPTTEGLDLPNNSATAANAEGSTTVFNQLLLDAEPSSPLLCGSAVGVTIPTRDYKEEREYQFANRI